MKHEAGDFILHVTHYYALFVFRKTFIGSGVSLCALITVIACKKTHLWVSRFNESASEAGSGGNSLPAARIASIADLFKWRLRQRWACSQAVKVIPTSQILNRFAFAWKYQICCVLTPFGRPLKRLRVNRQLVPKSIQWTHKSNNKMHSQIQTVSSLTTFSSKLLVPWTAIWTEIQYTWQSIMGTHSCLTVIYKNHDTTRKNTVSLVTTI